MARCITTWRILQTNDLSNLSPPKTRVCPPSPCQPSLHSPPSSSFFFSFFFCLVSTHATYSLHLLLILLSWSAFSSSSPLFLSFFFCLIIHILLLLLFFLLILFHHPLPSTPPFCPSSDHHDLLCLYWFQQARTTMWLAWKIFEDMRTGQHRRSEYTQLYSALRRKRDKGNIK